MRIKSYSRLRWWLAVRANKIPETCWTKLVQWTSLDADKPWSLWSEDFKVDWMCKEDAKNNGSCYCGKLKGGEQ